MKLAGLQIHRFGARSELTLSNIDPHLNVVYGPNGSGKTTVIQFIRWMLYGQCDEISRPYPTTAESTAGGSMTVSADGHVSRTFRRESQSGSLLSQLTVDGVSSGPTNLATISNTEFDRFFVVSFDQPRNLGDLFNSARIHGYQLHLDQRHLDRVRELTEQLARQRSELSRYTHIGSVDVLRSQREDKRREIDSIRLDWQRRREELERRRGEASSEVAEQQRLCERLHSVLSNIDAAIETRKHQLAEEHTQWLAARRDSEQKRQARIHQIDSQISRWQEILTEVRTQLEQVRSRISSYGDVGFSPTEATDLHFFMRKLGFRIRDIEQDLHSAYESDTWRDHEADADYLRGLLGSALNSMQNDVTRLAQTVERQQQSNELLECREELTYLCRVERELMDLLEALARQRDNLHRDSKFVPTSSVSYLHSIDTLLPDQTLPHNTTLSGYTFTDSQDIRQREINSLSAIELANALDDFRLRHLVERRESAAARLSEADLELTNRQRRLREIEEELSRFDRDGRIAILEKEIAEIDEQLRHAEVRNSIERNIAALEEELRRAREHTGRSEIVDEASALLQRLTNKDYLRITVANNYRCEVERADGKKFSHDQLSRGVQDQVYLAISLAIVCAYGRKGVAVPLILNDVFVNLDETGIHALTDLLADFASRGHQTLVFTRHAHIRELFQGRAVRLFGLNDLDSAYQPTQQTYTPPVYIPPRPYIPPQTFAAPIVEREPIPEDPTYSWVAEWQRRDPVHPTPPAPSFHPKPTPQAPQQYPDPPLPEPPPEPEARVEPLIGLDSPLTATPTLSDDLVQLLAGINIHHVRDFVEYDPDAIADQLAENGVTAEMIQRRQRELLMLAYLAVSVLDAQLLVACGVPDPARLGRADEAVLLKRVETILERPQATERFGPFSGYSLARIRRWIERARRSNYRDHGRSRRSYSSNYSRRSFDFDNSSRARSRNNGTRSTSSRSSNGTSRSRSTNGSSTRTSRRSRASQTTTSEKGLRFYLEINDPVVDAPEIGPRMAERLNEIDIYTVSNLLDADAAEIAAQLNDKRISAETVEQWQLQAQLVCRIPNLRGHDAQILVGCGIEDPVTLSAMDAATFLPTVTKYVATKDGQRALRNNKHPDLAEVTAWIDWSESARPLRAG